MLGQFPVGAFKLLLLEGNGRVGVLQAFFAAVTHLDQAACGLKQLDVGGEKRLEFGRHICVAKVGQRGLGPLDGLLLGLEGIETHAYSTTASV